MKFLLKLFIFVLSFATISFADIKQVKDNFFTKRIPICGVLGGGYNKDFNKLIELHTSLHKTCAKYI